MNKPKNPEFDNNVENSIIEEGRNQLAERLSNLFVMLSGYEKTKEDFYSEEDWDEMGKYDEGDGIYSN